MVVGQALGKLLRALWLGRGTAARWTAGISWVGSTHTLCPHRSHSDKHRAFAPLPGKGGATSAALWRLTGWRDRGKTPVVQTSSHSFSVSLKQFLNVKLYEKQTRMRWNLTFIGPKSWGTLDKGTGWQSLTRPPRPA